MKTSILSTYLEAASSTRRPTPPLFILSSGSIVLMVPLLLVALNTAQLAAASDSNLYNQLSKVKITPDIIDASYANLVQVYLHGKSIKPGDPIQARHFKEIDIFKTEWASSNSDAQHTLILLDLDRKLRANSSQTSFYNQYTSVNIPGHDVVRGQAIVSLEPPTVPCAPSVKHRILMLVFHQSQTIDLSDVVNIAAAPGQTSKRENFKLDTFMQRHRLSLIAANVFMAMGETNGVCSGATSHLPPINSFQSSLSWCMIAMVTVLAANLRPRATYL